jgi:hypothetical protein
MLNHPVLASAESGEVVPCLRQAQVTVADPVEPGVLIERDSGAALGNCQTDHVAVSS